MSHFELSQLKEAEQFEKEEISFLQEHSKKDEFFINIPEKK